jgi:glycosyltransferase involved in cell wall biosynthesis
MRIDLESFSVQLQEKENLNQSQKNQIEKMRIDLESFSVQLQEKEKIILSLKDQLIEKEHVELSYENEINELVQQYEEKLFQKKQTLQTLLSRLAWKEKELTVKISENQTLLSELSLQKQEANYFSSQLWEIQHSRAWRIVQLIWKTRIKYFPPGSKQSRILRTSINGYKVLKNEGLISFFKSAFKKLSKIKLFALKTKQLDKIDYQTTTPSVSLIYPNPVYIPDKKIITEEPQLIDIPYPNEPSDSHNQKKKINEYMKYKDFVLSISHDNYLSINFGGIQMFMVDEQALFDKQQISYIHLYPINTDDYFNNESALMLGLNVDSKHIGQFSVEDIVSILETLLVDQYKCKSLILHQFKGWTLNAIQSIISITQPFSLIFYIHDYFSICPQHNLLRNLNEFCNAPSVESNACTICEFGEKRKIHLPFVRQLFTIFPWLIVAPSKSAEKNWNKTFPDFNGEVIIEPHKKIRETSIKHEERDLNIIRIAYAGQAVSNKGWELWRKFVDQFSSKTEYELYHLGTREEKNIEQFESVRVSSQNRTAMMDELNMHRIDVLFHCPIWPETFSYVLYEAIGSGCFVITTRQSGNIADFVQKNKNGIVFESFPELLQYLNDPINLRKDLKNFHENNPKVFELEVNDNIINYVKNHTQYGSTK